MALDRSPEHKTCGSDVVMACDMSIQDGRFVR